MGNTCKSMANSCQCMTKPLQCCKVISLQLIKINEKIKEKKKVLGLCVSLASWESYGVPEPITEARVRGSLLGWWGCGLDQCGEEQAG